MSKNAISNMSMVRRAVAACPSWWWWWWWWCWWTWQWWRWWQWGWCVHLWLWTQSEDLAGFPATALLYKLFPLLFPACTELGLYGMDTRVKHGTLDFPLFFLCNVLVLLLEGDCIVRFWPLEPCWRVMRLGWVPGQYLSISVEADPGDWQ